MGLWKKIFGGPEQHEPGWLKSQEEKDVYHARWSEAERAHAASLDAAGYTGAANGAQKQSERDMNVNESARQATMDRARDRATVENDLVDINREIMGMQASVDFDLQRGKRDAIERRTQLERRRDDLERELELLELNN